MGQPAAVGWLDMSVISDRYVANALPKLLTEWRMKKRWSDMPPEARTLHANILKSYLATGGPPEITDLNPAMLEDLQQRDLIVVKQGAIHSAYPFSSVPTAHRVHMRGISNFCVCAIDALGAPCMAGAAAHVDLECAQCGHKISIRIDGAENVLEQSDPAHARIWAGTVQIEGCAATTQCQSMLAYCSEAHLQEWRSAQPITTNGFSFSIEQAVQAGAAIFRPFLPRAAGITGNAPTLT
jgi:hypothetical protein